MASKCVFLFVSVQFVLTFFVVKAYIPATIVFGDSSVDAGNNNFIPTVARSNFPPYGRDFNGGVATGRFSNGKVPTDYISEAFGLTPTVPAYLDPAYNISDFAVGVTFASAGTGYDNATSDVLSVIPLWKQIDYYKEYQKKLRAYLGETKANIIIKEALYETSLGTNDFMENYYTIPGGRARQFTVQQFQDFLIEIAQNFVKNLYSLGARKISLTGLPPMGCMPLVRARNFIARSECMDRYNDVASEFNGKLNKMVVKLNNELDGVKIVFSDSYHILLDIIKKPSSFGFDVASLACCATGMYEMGYFCARESMYTCTNADKYVFWDAFHPTQKTSKIVADHLVNNFMKPIFV